MSAFYKILGISLIVGILALVSRPAVIRCTKDPRMTEALNNVRQLRLALMNFEAEYGSFPDEATMLKLVTEKGIDAFPLTFSNDYLRQLVASGLASEQPGYSRHDSLPSHKPDGVIAPLEQAFGPGECGFAYIAGLTSRDAPDTPLLVAPLIPGTYRFDPKPFAGRAIVLKLGGSATTRAIREDGLVSIGGGRTLFGTDAPYWQGKKPRIKYPAK